MTDFILKVEAGYEHLANRQSAKINYLQQEISQLQDSIKDLEIVYKINKDALRIACQQFPKQTAPKKEKEPESYSRIGQISQSTMSQSQSRSLSQKRGRIIDNPGNHDILVQKLIDENEQLMARITKITKERDTAQSKALINIQIAEQVQLHENEILQEFEEKITELRRIIQDKEYTIQEFEKSKPIVENGVLFKCKEVNNQSIYFALLKIATPSEQVIKLHNENEELKNHIAELQQQIQDLNVQNSEFTLNNFVNINLQISIYFKKEFKKRIIQNQIIFSQLSQYLSIKKYNNLLLYIYFKDYALTGEEDVSVDEKSTFLRDFYDLKKIADEYQENNESDSEQNPNKLQIQIPSIDITKAQQVQQKILERKFGKDKEVNQEEQKKFLDKFTKVEEEYKKFKKLWEREVLGNKLLLENLKVIDTFANTTVETNGVLLNSNRLLSERCVKILSAADFFYTFYMKYISLLRLKQVKHSKSLEDFSEMQGESQENNKEINVSILEEELQKDLQLKNKKQRIKKSRKVEQEQQQFEEQLTPEFDQGDNELHSKITDEFKQLKEEIITTEQQFQGQEIQKAEFDEFDLEECKIYLLNMARDLFCENHMFNDMITKEMLKNVKFNQHQPQKKFKNHFKIQRTLSNALDYVSENIKLQIEGDIKRNVTKEKKRFVKDPNQLQLQEQEKSALIQEERQIGYVKKRGYIPFQADDISQILAAGYNPNEEEFNKTQRMEDLQLLEFK